MFQHLCLLALVSALVATVVADVPADRVTSLPGWEGAPPTPTYSGFFATDASNQGFLHYYLALSQNQPKTDPIVLWLQGGPGCSSLFGNFYENGPLQIRDPKDASSAPFLVGNQFAWTQNASMIWLEQPVGVGFSYCVQGGSCNNQFYDDAYGFFVNFFAAYPELASNEFYISGESYAGVYVPYIANAIRAGNRAGKNPQINLVGLLVGNGLGGDAPDNIVEQRSYDFLYGHTLYSFEAQQAIYASCNWTAGASGSACQSALNFADSQVGPYYIYNIYDNCPHDLASISIDEEEKYLFSPRIQFGAPANRPYGASGQQINGFVCVLESTSSTWFDTAEVQQALHVTQANVTQWEVCGVAKSSEYNRNAEFLKRHRLQLQANKLMAPSQDLGSLYLSLLSDYPILIYGGDTDQCVPYYYSDEWTKALGFPPIAGQTFRQWYIDEQENTLGGYLTNYNTGGNKTFTFITVKDSGHMVPQYQPAAALAFFNRWIYHKQI